MKLSIIIPVYNVESYLHKCVDSVLKQDLPSTEYEIILVDDGSTDNCGAICDEYVCKSQESRAKSQAYPLIRVIHQENGGLSVARNSGIQIANGDCIMFVDSDDYIEPNMLGSLVKMMDENQLDILRYNYRNVNEQYEEFYPNKDPKRDVDYSEEVTDGETFLNERLGPACYAWQFVIRRDLIYSSLSTIDSCLFKKGIYFEDTEWTPRMLLRAKRVTSTPVILYNYLWRTGSITLPTDPTKREKVLRDKLSLLRGFQEQKKLMRNPKWFTWMTSFNTMSILGLLVALPSHERKAYIAELKSLRVFPLSTYRTNCNERLKVQFANLSPNLYCNLMRLRE